MTEPSLFSTRTVQVLVATAARARIASTWSGIGAAVPIEGRESAMKKKENAVEHLMARQIAKHQHRAQESQIALEGPYINGCSGEPGGSIGGNPTGLRPREGRKRSSGRYPGKGAEHNPDKFRE